MEYVPWEEGALELGFNEELGVEQVGGRVEGRTRDRGVDVVGRSDGVPIQCLDVSTRSRSPNIWATYEARRATTSAGVKPPASLKR